MAVRVREDGEIWAAYEPEGTFRADPLAAKCALKGAQYATASSAAHNSVEASYSIFCRGVQSDGPENKKIRGPTIVT